MFRLTELLPRRLPLMGAVILLGFGSTFVAVRSTQTPVATNEKSPEVATNVVWLVLDEAPLYPILRTDGTINQLRFPGFAMLASESTFYRDTLTTAQRTTEAVPAILDGKWPSYKKYPYLRDHPDNLFTLTKNKLRLDVFQAVTHLCPKNVCQNGIPPDLRSPIYFADAMEEFAKKASESVEQTLHFAHVLLPHRPWTLTPELRHARELPSDSRSGTLLDRRRDSYQGLLRQYIATDSLLLQFLTRFKASPNWDRTMLIVTADHGITFVPGESVRDQINVKNPQTLEDIFRVPLFVKYPNQQTSSISDCQVSSIDILPTVLSVLKISSTARLDGIDLNNHCPRSRNRRISWPYAHSHLSTDFSAALKRVSYYNEWINANGDAADIYRVGRSGVLIGTAVPVSTQIREGVSWANVDPDAFVNISNERFGYVPARVTGRVTLTTELCGECEGVLVVDGVIVASIPELAGGQPSNTPSLFTTSVDTRTLTSKSGVGELWIADWTTGKPELSRVGPSVGN